MKCIRCGHDSKFKDRASRRCPGCGKEFAFEPQAGDPYTDRRFQAAIERVSAQGKVRFLPEHVRYDLMRDKPTDALMIAAVVTTAIAVVTFIAFIFLLSVVGAGAVALIGVSGLTSMMAIATASKRWGNPPVRGIDAERFYTLWSRYLQTHGTPAGLVLGPRKIASPTKELSDELVHYSFDRVVICDRRETAEILLANEFHFENNCAVLTFDGYPRDIFATVLAMLRNNPRIEVFALHDATPDGCAMAHRLRTEPVWFKDVGTVYDVAFRPEQAKRFETLCVRASEPAPEDPGYSEDERQWLSQWTLALECLPPEQLIKRLFRAMHQLPEQADGADGGLVWVGDASASDGGGDSFG